MEALHCELALVVNFAFATTIAAILTIFTLKPLGRISRGVYPPKDEDADFPLFGLVGGPTPPKSPGRRLPRGLAPPSCFGLAHRIYIFCYQAVIMPVYWYFHWNFPENITLLLLLRNIRLYFVLTHRAQYSGDLESCFRQQTFNAR